MPNSSESMFCCAFVAAEINWMQNISIIFMQKKRLDEYLFMVTELIWVDAVLLIIGSSANR